MLGKVYNYDLDTNTFSFTFHRYSVRLGQGGGWINITDVAEKWESVIIPIGFSKVMVK